MSAVQTFLITCLWIGLATIIWPLSVPRFMAALLFTLAIGMVARL